MIAIRCMTTNTGVRVGNTGSLAVAQCCGRARGWSAKGLGPTCIGPKRKNSVNFTSFYPDNNLKQNNL